MEKNKLTIYTDGGARGNPGPAAIGIVMEELGKEYSEFIGETTNNVAEYRAVIFALTKVRQILGGDVSENTEIEVRSDSELLVRQMNAKYKIKNEEIKNLFVEVWNRMQDFKKVSFVHTPREKNKAADALVNKALDMRLV